MWTRASSTGLGNGKLTPRIMQEGQLDAIADEAERAKLAALVELVGRDGDQLMALAIQFIRANVGVSSVLLGSKNLAHIAHNLELVDTPLPPGMLERAIAICS